MQNSSFYDRNSIQTWTFNTIGVTRLTGSGIVDSIYYVNSEFPNSNLYKQDKNYQFLTTVTGSSTSTLSIKLSPPFRAGIVKELNIIPNGILYYTYANPISSENSVNIIKYGAPSTFINYISDSSIREIDFLINGYREFRYLDVSVNDESQPNGWCYEIDSSFIGSYKWYFSSTSSASPIYSAFGSGLEEVSIDNNYIATLISYDYFNLDFNFNFTGGNSDDIIEVFLVNQKDLKSGKNKYWSLIETLNINGTFSKINLSSTNTNGTKKYLVFKANISNTTRTSPYIATLYNINIVGGYNPLNNLQVIPTDNLQVNIPNSVYDFQSVVNGLTYSLSSKIGNGYFKAGIWENGVWNNGWRDDTLAKDFDDIYSSILYGYDISWKIKIRGSIESCSLFKVGDKVAIGNIVAIDINENRKLIKDYYTISDIGSDIVGSSVINWIEVNLETTFPYRRIEKDSNNHKIKVTKNIWLSGAFFNGYFSGVWNNGLFKGYPKITEMFDTHWIDGFFNGGHFNSNYPYFYFSDIMPTENCQLSNITLIFGTVSGRNSGHNLVQGDYIIIDKDLIFTTNLDNSITPKLFNEEYNGIVKVLSVNGIYVTVDKKYLVALTSAETGKVTRYTASSVIQNFKFYDTNKSKLKSSESTISSSVFSFNSWIDTNYDDTRSVTIGRDFRSYEPLTTKSINKNNLYGYPTYDVLSSASRFRNSFDLDYGLYKLGTKYKVFTDFIGDASEFNEPFDTSLVNISNFYDLGWTFSYKNNSNLSFNRSESILSTDSASIVSTTIQDYIDSGVTGNELYITATNSGAILNNDKVDITKKRYTIVEFDVITYSVADYKFTQTNQNPYNILTTNTDIFSLPATQSGISLGFTTFTASNIFSFDRGSQGLIVDPSSGLDFREFNGEVWSIDRQSDGKIIVTGNFTTYGGVATPISKICRINTNGLLDSGFIPSINDINDSSINFMKTLVTYDDNIYIYINYDTEVVVNGHASVLGRTIRLNSNGSYSGLLQKEFNGPITDFAVRDIDGILIVVGNFTQFYDTSNTYWINKIIFFSQNGSFTDISTDINLYSTSNIENRGFNTPSDIPSCIKVLTDGSILIGGKITVFRNYNYVSYFTNGIIKLKINSSDQLVIDTNFISNNTSINNKGFIYPTNPEILPNSSYDFVNRIDIDGSNGKIYVVGNFSTYNDGSPRSCYNIIRLTPLGLYDISFNTGQGLNKSVYDIKVGPQYQQIYIGGVFTKYNGQDCGKLISIKSNGLLESSVNTLEPNESKVTTISLSNFGSLNIRAGGSFTSYVEGTNVPKTIITSDYVISESILPSDIINLLVNINLDCNSTNLGNITINLISPNGKIINLKNVTPLSTETQFSDTTFDYLSNILLSSGSSPYSGTFSMSKLLSKGTIGYLSDSTTFDELVTTNTSGTWTIYVQNETLSYPTLISWDLSIVYKGYIDDTSIEITPSVDIPIIHFNNLNYDITSQPSGYGDSIPIYKKMSYLPITQNINHLSIRNSFRLDSIEKTSPERFNGFGSNTIKKKYEYFYNKTDLMMTIQGNGDIGSSQSMLVLDNIKMYETDMIPFFKYFEDSNIYKGIQVPYEGLAPNIDYLNSDFIFVDNITIGLDSIDGTILTNNNPCVPNIITIISASVSVVTNEPLNITTTSVKIGGIITIQGNISYQSGGINLSVDNPPNVSVFTGSVNNTNLSTTIDNLIPNTTYYVQTYAITNQYVSTNGSISLFPPVTTYGEILSFTTVALPPDYSPNDYSGDYNNI